MTTEWSDLGAEDFSHLTVLRKVAPEAVQGILGSCETRTLEANEVLIDETSPSRELYFVLEGKLSVHVISEGETLPIYIEVGQTVGELSVIDHRPPSALVRAEYFSRILVVTEDKFWRLIDVSHQFAKNMLLLLSERMRSDNAMLKESIIMKNMFEEQTTQDPLTGLHNRRWIDLHLTKLIRRARFSNEPLTAMMIDIDHFKSVNDTYGHLKGDVVLKMVAEIIHNSIRPRDFACRYGGEEFLVLFPETSLNNGLIAAERIRQTVERETKARMEELETPAVTITGGLSSLEDYSPSVGDDEYAETILHSADSQLYDGKMHGRNRIVS